MIETVNLVKHFGRLEALRGVSMKVQEGDIYGLIGPNGAGKSTMFRILSTIMRPTSGVATICGVPVSQGDKVRKLIGYMPDVFGVYEDMTVYEYLEFFAAAYYIKSKERKALINGVLELTDLGFKKAAMVKSLSRGMQQRLGVARVLVHDPKVLILDEPASGLDPRARIELRELLKELRRLGKTILISSHILSELAEICNRIGIIEKGALVFEGTKEDLSSRLSGLEAICIEVDGKREEALCFLGAHPGVDKALIEDGFIRVRLKGDFKDVPGLLGSMVSAGYRISRFNPEEPSLEAAFMALTKGKLA